MSIFGREMKANAKALLIWCAAIIFLTMAGMAKFSGLTSVGSQELLQLYHSLPKAFAFLWGSPGLDLTTPEGFYGIVYAYILLIAGIYAGLLGSRIFSKEECDKTTESSVTKPFTRNRIVGQKLLATLVNLVVFALVVFLTSTLTLRDYNVSSHMVQNMAWIAGGTLLVELIFAGIGLLAAAIIKDPKRSGCVTVLILLATYFIGIVVQALDGWQFLKVFSPFSYYSTASIIDGHALSLPYALLGFSVCMVCLGAALIISDHQDLAIRGELAP